MDVVITPHELTGTIDAIASKSMAHRLLICAALCSGPTRIECSTSSRDIEATIECLKGLGAKIERSGSYLNVEPISGASSSDNIRVPKQGALLDCGESGSTLRFMLPVVAALGCDASLTGHGRLSERPLSPLYEELIAGGAEISEQGNFPMSIRGKLRAGRFELPGNVSSQYVSSLLLAAPLMGGPTEIRVSNPVESKPYIDLTISALNTFGVEVAHSQETVEGRSYTTFVLSPSTPFTSPGEVVVEGDWSNAAFWFAAGALGQGITVNNVPLQSRQGDKAILAALAKLGARVSRKGTSANVSLSTPTGTNINASDFPDLVPPLAAVAALCPGHTSISGCERLRLKESDRIETVCAGLAALGADITHSASSIEINGKESLAGGVVDAANDHRIAMMAAVAATRCTAPVTILGAECTEKSYPAFFDDYCALGGTIELKA